MNFKRISSSRNNSFIKLFLLSSAFVATSASAITVDFTDSSWSGAYNQDPFSVIQDGITITAEAANNDPNIVDNAKLHWDSKDGLGIDPTGTYSYEKDEIEGFEVLTIRFDQVVNLNSIGLSDFFIERDINGNLFTEQGEYWVNDDTATKERVHAVTSFNNGELLLQGLDVNITSISFASLGRILGSQNHEFALQSLGVSAVPVPAAIWLFGSALLGMVTISRRRKSLS